MYIELDHALVPGRITDINKRSSLLPDQTKYKIRKGNFQDWLKDTKNKTLKKSLPDRKRKAEKTQEE